MNILTHIIKTNQRLEDENRSITGYRSPRNSLKTIFSYLTSCVLNQKKLGFSRYNKRREWRVKKRWKMYTLKKKQIPFYISSYIFFFWKKNYFSADDWLYFFLFSHDLRLSRIKEVALAVIVLAFYLLNCFYCWRWNLWYKYAIHSKAYIYRASRFSLGFYRFSSESVMFTRSTKYNINNI